MKKVFEAALFKHNNKEQKRWKRFQNMEKPNENGQLCQLFLPHKCTREFIIKMILFFISEWLWSAKEIWDISSPSFCLFYFISFGSVRCTFLCSLKFLFSSTSRYCCTHIFELLDISIFYAHCTFSVWGLFYIHLFAASVYRGFFFVALQGKTQPQ